MRRRRCRLVLPRPQIQGSLLVVAQARGGDREVGREGARRQGRAGRRRRLAGRRAGRRWRRQREVLEEFSCKKKKEIGLLVKKRFDKLRRALSKIFNGGRNFLNALPWSYREHYLKIVLVN